MKSTVGRPRRLTDEQVASILTWHEQIVAWKAMRARLITQRQLARDLGVSPATISHVISVRGQYKQPSPERRGPEIARRRTRIARLRI